MTALFVPALRITGGRFPEFAEFSRYHPSAEPGERGFSRMQGCTCRQTRVQTQPVRPSKTSSGRVVALEPFLESLWQLVSLLYLNPSPFLGCVVLGTEFLVIEVKDNVFLVTSSVTYLTGSFGICVFELEGLGKSFSISTSIVHLLLCTPLQ